MENRTEPSSDYRRMEILQAVLPYIPVSMQNFLTIYLGLEELFHAIQMIRNSAFSSIPQGAKEKNISELLPVLRKLCTPQENEMIDTFFQMSKMMELYGTYKEHFPLSDSEKNRSESSVTNLFRMLQNAPKNQTEIDDLFKDFTT